MRLVVTILIAICFAACGGGGGANDNVGNNDGVSDSRDALPNDSAESADTDTDTDTDTDVDVDADGDNTDEDGDGGGVSNVDDTKVKYYGTKTPSWIAEAVKWFGKAADQGCGSAVG